MSLDDTPSTAGSPQTITSIPLSDPNVDSKGDPSIGSLVKDVTTNASTLVRAEIALAKAEIIADGKKALTGSIFFIAAAVVLLFSVFFFFFFLIDLLDIWLPRWAASLIVFLLMVAVAAVAGVLGFLKVRKIRGPKKTMKTVNQLPSVLPSGSKKGTYDADAAGPAITTRSTQTVSRVAK